MKRSARSARSIGVQTKESKKSKSFMNSKKQYMAPELTVVSFKAERGYASSEMRLLDVSFLSLDMEEGSFNGYNSQGQQSWSTDDEGYFGSRW